MVEEQQIKKSKAKKENKKEIKTEQVHEPLAQIKREDLRVEQDKRTGLADEQKNLGALSEKKKEEPKIETAIKETPIQTKPEENKPDQKIETKIEKKKEEIKKKDYAIVNGNNLPISTKESMDICSMIRGRNMETAIKMLEEVIAFKRVVKMNKREVPHQKGKGVMAGRYPINSSKEFIRMLKQLNANAIVNGLEIEKCKIFCKANFASRPYKRGGAKFKRTHVLIKLELKKIKNKR